MQLDEIQLEGIRLGNEGKNLFITGDPGCGKSTLVNNLAVNTRKNLALLAPTGIAALNIGGSTLHRFFRFPREILINDNFLDHISEETIERIHATDTFVVDEISMNRADNFQGMDTILREFGDSKAPFGGKQMIVVGDFQQLPPVVTPREQSTFEKHFYSPYAFDTKAWKEAEFNTIHLTNPHRGAEDPTFLKYLQLLKKGNKYAVDLFNENCKTEPNPNFITLASTNAIADSINSNNLYKLKGREYEFESDISGELELADYPTDKTLNLKVGARVMTLVNDNRDRFCNGDLGTIIEIYNGRSIVVKLDNGNEVLLSPYTWEISKYVNVDNKLEKKVIGEFIQLPIRLGWAITIHKAQGTTLEGLNLELGNSGCFCHGQLLVALSRAKRLNGIHILTPIREKDLIFDSRVKQFHKELFKARL